MKEIYIYIDCGEILSHHLKPLVRHGIISRYRANKIKSAVLESDLLLIKELAALSDDVREAVLSRLKKVREEING